MKNKTTINARNRESYRRNKVKRLAARKRYYQTNKAKIAARHKRWGIKNIERRRFHNRKEIYKRRTLKKNGRHTFLQWEAVKKKWNHCCADCGMQEPFTDQHYQKLTEDHIVPLSKGGSNNIENIKPLCARCNTKKGDRL